MNRQELAQEVINKYGEEAQRLMMIEEMAELTAAICQVQRGRFCSDRVAEETADCLAVLDQMDILFKIPESRDNSEFFAGYPVLVATIGEIQVWLGLYQGEDYEKKELKALLYRLRLELIGLSAEIGEDRVEAWRKNKHDRMLERLEAE